MPANFTIPLITVISGQTITASLWNNEFENIDTNFIPSGMDDMSGTDSAMQIQTDPYPSSATSRPTSLAGEIERLRYQLAQITGETYWYVDPDTSIASMKSNFDAHTHDGTTNNGPQINTAGIANNAVTADKIATAVAGDGLAGGGGTALSVNVDASTIEINSDTLRVKDAGITASKLASGIDFPGNVRASTGTCFFAYTAVDQSNVTGDGTLYKVLFASIAFDQNSNYSTSTSTFTAPIAGKYMFTAQVNIADAASGNKNELFIVTTTRTFTKEDWPSSNLTQTMTVIADMSANDTAIVRIKGTGGALVQDVKASGSVSGGIATFFTGKLIA